MHKKFLVLFLAVSIILGACSQRSSLDSPKRILSQVYDAIRPVITRALSGDPDPSQNILSGVTPEIRVAQKSMMVVSDDPRYEIQMTIPYLAGDQGLVSSFNSKVESQASEVREAFLSDVTEREAARGEGAMPAVSSLRTTYDLTYASNQLFSVHVQTTAYLAISAHPFTTSTAYNYDAQHGRFLMLKDLFLSEADFYELILGYVESALSVRDFGYQAGTAEEVLLTRENWNILSEGLRINFDAYEVGPGAAGPQYVVIPWEDLFEILDKDGPVGRIVIR